MSVLKHNHDSRLSSSYSGWKYLILISRIYPKFLTMVVTLNYSARCLDDKLSARGPTQAAHFSYNTVLICEKRRQCKGMLAFLCDSFASTHVKIILFCPPFLVWFVPYKYGQILDHAISFGVTHPYSSLN